jgi:hypothetical protein
MRAGKPKKRRRTRQAQHHGFSATVRDGAYLRMRTSGVFSLTPLQVSAHDGESAITVSIETVHFAHGSSGTPLKWGLNEMFSNRPHSEMRPSRRRGHCANLLRGLPGPRPRRQTPNARPETIRRGLHLKRNPARASSDPCDSLKNGCRLAINRPRLVVYVFSVAQICNLLYRRFLIGRASESSSAPALAELPQNTILRYRRL